MVLGKHYIRKLEIVDSFWAQGMTGIVFGWIMFCLRERCYPIDRNWCEFAYFLTLSRYIFLKYVWYALWIPSLYVYRILQLLCLSSLALGAIKDSLLLYVTPILLFGFEFSKINSVVSIQCSQVLTHICYWISLLISQYPKSHSQLHISFSSNSKLIS